jgi:UDP-N-acetylglucosamine--N-acetylmuramyl-(pentapeptide) pyrophosphoryl-undecaprenol N-acetylglucosamine transferase
MPQTADRGVILLCAGGTGGHLFPAEALAHVLAGRGYRIHLATDARAAKYSGAFPAERIHFIRSATVFGRSPLAIGKAAVALARGYLQSRSLIRQSRPVAAIGFGGYPTLPPMLAACHARVPTLIHDANAVMGRANRFLAARASRIAVGFGSPELAPRAVVTGNPVRPAVIEAARISYPDREPGDLFHLLVFGGSQGAQVFSGVVPAAVALLTEAQRNLMRIVQQARPEDRDRVVARYRELSVKAEVETFFSDLPTRIAAANLTIARGGASTVSELAVIGRPSILVPLPHAIDQDQARNAAALADHGGAQVVRQSELSPQRLAALLSDAISGPAKLADAAQNARALGRPDAAIALADCLEELIAPAAGAKTKEPAA